MNHLSPSSPVRLAVLAALLFVSCTTTTTTRLPACTIPAPRVEPAKAAPGDIVSLYTDALTADWDTVVSIGSVRATVLGVQRDNCSDCDECLDPSDTADTGHADCNACTYSCDSCAEVCATCVQYVRITVPDLAAGSWPVVIQNVHGASETGTIEIVAPTP